MLSEYFDASTHLVESRAGAAKSSEKMTSAGIEGAVVDGIVGCMDGGTWGESTAPALTFKATSTPAAESSAAVAAIRTTRRRRLTGSGSVCTSRGRVWRFSPSGTPPSDALPVI